MKKLLLSLFSWAFCMNISASQNLNPSLIREPILTTEIAQKILDLSIQQAKKRNFQVSITIVDRSGQVLLVYRDYKAGVHTLQASYKKAYTAASQKRETAEILRGIQDKNIPEDIRYLDSNFSAMPGGIPIVIDGVYVGGIGVGGAHGEQDVEVARAGLRFLKDLK